MIFAMPATSEYEIRRAILRFHPERLVQVRTGFSVTRYQTRFSLTLGIMRSEETVPGFLLPLSRPPEGKGGAILGLVAFFGALTVEAGVRRWEKMAPDNHAC